MPLITSTTPTSGSGGGGGKNKLNGSSNKINKLTNGGVSPANSAILKVKFPPKKIKQEKQQHSPIKPSTGGGQEDNIDIEYDDEQMQMQHDDMMADENVSDSEYNQLNLNSIIQQQQQQQPQFNGNNTLNGSANGTPNGANYEYECQACEKKFKYFCYYKRHMDACHSEWPKYVCDTCSKSYKWEASFRQHLRSHHANLAGQYGAMGSGMPPTQAELAAAAAAVGLSQNGGGGDNDNIPYDEEYIGDDAKSDQQSNNNNNVEEQQVDVQQQQQQPLVVNNENSI